MATKVTRRRHTTVSSCRKPRGSVRYREAGDRAMRITRLMWENRCPIEAAGGGEQGAAVGQRHRCQRGK